MRIVINISNLYVGGGLQVALSFINELKALNKCHAYHVFLSTAANTQLDKKSFKENFNFYLIQKSPASLKTRRKTIMYLDALEKQIQPDIVFSVFGPSYWKPKAKHIMGFALPWVLRKDSVAYSELGIIKRIKMRLLVEYVSYYTKRDSSIYIIETEDGKNRLSQAIGIPIDNISVVGNSYSSIFDDPQYLSQTNPYNIELPPREADEFRLLLISHNYPHKNLKIINKIIPLLAEKNIKFVLTVDEKSYKSLFNYNDIHILNLGPVNHKSCPSLYKQCDGVFLPTLLEVFSASYPEAMKMKKPILTSHYSFATDICHDAALYFDPLDPNDIAKQISKLVKDRTLQTELIEKGKMRVQEFETARSRAVKYIHICEDAINY